MDGILQSIRPSFKKNALSNVKVLTYLPGTGLVRDRLRRPAIWHAVKPEHERHS